MTSRRTRDFKKQFEALPNSVQSVAMQSFQLWRSDLRHPSVHFKRVDDKDDIWSARIGLGHRALCTRIVTANEQVYVWFWIGTHAEYDELLS